jgi:prepilin-type N-terminal cleavage/methylation domain-containing protein
MGGFTLPEILVTLGVGALFLAMIAMVFVNTTQSFAIISNRVSMNHETRMALDQMTRGIRGAGDLVTFSTNQLVFTFNGTNNLIYRWDGLSRQLVQWKTGDAQTNVLLNGCDSLQFSMFKNAPLPGGAATNATTVGQAKCISVAWECSRTVLGKKLTTEDMQQALIVIRNKLVL